jgi:hypothetical protein
LLLPQRPDDVRSARRRPADVFLPAFHYGAPAVGCLGFAGWGLGRLGVHGPQEAAPRHCCSLRGSTR